MERFKWLHQAGDLWGGLASTLVALPSAIAFGVTIFSPLGAGYSAQGAVAGILGATIMGLVAASFGGTDRLITSPCAPAAAVLSALAITLMHQGMSATACLLTLMLISLLTGILQVALGLAGIGSLIKFIPYPVVSGYLSGVGLTIIASQIPWYSGRPKTSGCFNPCCLPKSGDGKASWLASQLCSPWSWCLASYGLSLQPLSPCSSA